MKELANDALKWTIGFLTNRIVWMFMLTAVLFFILAGELFHLQIVISDTFTIAPPPTTTVEQTIPAPRGNIYDRFGRPLTTNITAHVVTMDPSVSESISNEALLELTRLFERNGETFLQEFPMTNEWPYEFTLGGGTPEIRQARIFRWNDDMTVPDPGTTSAADSFVFLREQFNIDPELSNEDARRILNLREQLYVRRFNPQLFDIASDVSFATVAAIEEQSAFFSGVGIDIRTLREYPQGQYFSHMLGYTGRVTDQDLLAFPDDGYFDDDMIGKTGLERSMERNLRGTIGTQLVEINPSTGRQVGTPPEVTSPIPGDNIFLTIDMDMQRRTFNILKDYLTEINIRRLQGGSPREGQVTPQQIFNNLITGGWIPIREVMETTEENAAYALRAFILERFPEATSNREDRAQIVRILVDGVNDGYLGSITMFSAMVDLGILSDNDDFLARVQSGATTVNNFVVEKMRLGEITPQMLNLDPSTGSVVVADVATGAILAAVGYPSFDNNMLANTIDAEYYARVNGDDPTHPLVNRPFMEGRAPGSTFKMISAAAGMETGVISPTSTIATRGAFTRAGLPAARCWNANGLGVLNVAGAIGISCNYFFFEVAMRLGSSQHQRIEVLNQFMEFFGLNQRTGVEVGELADTFNRDAVANIMSSPDLKRFQHLSLNEFAPRAQWDWFDGDTIRTAIGQSYNNYSAATMARYIAQIANNGVRLPFHLVDTVTTANGEIVQQANPVPEYTGMEMSEATWQTIQNGMIITTEGRGTATTHFRGFPIRVAAKTGTAEQAQTRPAHSSFGGFAPFENPEIAVYVMVPFGDTSAMSASATQIARDVIYAFLMPETTIEFPVARNVIVQ
ncbi:MAG: penicillin-binding transpeptidase domain-containing protein [Firmicutes bacterium]|nr:penicillin-binding transpeptidase domain-containing protein [Bacillota bacterium]